MSTESPNTGNPDATPLAFGALPTQELLEQAGLSALGLLEPDEQHAFDVAVSAAPDHVRAAIDAEMARTLELRPLLPPAEPRAELRRLVIEAVMADVRAREAVGAERGPIPFQPFGGPGRRGVSPLWRGAALGLLAACLALGTVFVQLVADAERVDSERLMAQVQDEIGARFVVDTLFSPGTQRRVFVPTSAAVGDAQVALWYNPEWDHARLYYRNLPDLEGRRYVLAEVDEAGGIVREVASFRATGVLTSVRAPIAMRDAQTPPRLALFAAGDGRRPELVMTMAPPTDLA